jgi:pimeloyl-ACP methyl ester carboxylesterase
MSERRPARTGFVEANGAKLYYDLLGDGRTLTLVHAGYVDRRMWDAQFAVFAQAYQVLRYDIRGHGQSTFPDLPFADEQDLFTLLSALGIETTILLGLSLGAWTAVDFTLQHPEMVEALVLVGAAVSGLPPELQPQGENLSPHERQEVARWNQALQEHDLPALVDVVMHDATLIPSLDRPAARQRVDEMVSHCSFAYYFKPELRQALTPPAYQRLAELRAATLLVIGSEDHPVLRRTAQALHERIAHARLAVLPDCHHLANMEQPEVFNQLVLEFLQGTYPSDETPPGAAS